MVVSVLIHGHQSWPLTEKVLVSLKHFNAKCLARIFDIGVDGAYRNQQELYDISAILRARRLKWVGDTLRIDVPSLAKEVLVARCTQFINSGMRVSGSTIMDLPVCESVKELMELASNKSEWSKLVHSIHPSNSQK